MAKMKKDAGEADRAIEYLRLSLAGGDDELNAQTQYEIAELYELKGRAETAASEYMKVSSLYGKGAFWAARADLKAAKLCEDMGRRDEAIGLYRKLAAMDIQESDFAKNRLGEIEGYKKALDTKSKIPGNTKITNDR
jgi:tetratricopeptide (TPR) repeat protein